MIALVGLGLLGAAVVVASRVGYLDRLSARLLPREQRVRLSAGDFPAGVAAPVGELASVPLRPTLIGFTPRGSSASLLLATGGAQAAAHPGPADASSGESAAAHGGGGAGSGAAAGSGEGILKASYALDARAVVFAREDDLRRALSLGAENGGVDMAAISVDRLAAWSVALRDASPRTVLLLGRSQGQEALAAVGVNQVSELKGKRIAVSSNGSSYFFALWLLSRAQLGPGDVTWVDLPQTLDAGRALREGKADAVVGLRGDVELAARDRGGKVLASTADAPHLVTTVLVARGDYAARYPDAVRRMLRGLLDAARQTLRDPAPGARLLGEVAPYLGDPVEAVHSAPPATLSDNLAFFGLAGEAPVTYDELFQSAAALFTKLGKLTNPPQAEDTRDLGALKYVSEARGP